MNYFSYDHITKYDITFVHKLGMYAYRFYTFLFYITVIYSSTHLCHCGIWINFAVMLFVQFHNRICSVFCSIGNVKYKHIIEFHSMYESQTVCSISPPTPIMRGSFRYDYSRICRALGVWTSYSMFHWYGIPFVKFADPAERL